MAGKSLSLIALGMALAFVTDAGAQQVAQISLAVTSPSPVSHPGAGQVRCVETRSWRSQSSGGHPVRPMRAAFCPYGVDEFARRVTSLSVDKEAIDSVETAEKIFGVPTMTTSEDNPRASSYQMMLTGKGGWMTMLWVSEGFYPTSKGPARFVPGLHPKRLYNVRDARLKISLFMSGPTLSQQTCIPVSPLFDALAKADWKEVPRTGMATPGDAQTHPQFRYGDKSVGVNGVRGDCTRDVEIMEDPKKA